MLLKSPYCYPCPEGHALRPACPACLQTSLRTCQKMILPSPQTLLPLVKIQRSFNISTTLQRNTLLACCRSCRLWLDQNPEHYSATQGKRHLGGGGLLSPLLVQPPQVLHLQSHSGAVASPVFLCFLCLHLAPPSACNDCV